MLEQDIRWINDNTFSGQTHVEIYFISNYRNNKSNGMQTRDREDHVQYTLDKKRSKQAVEPHSFRSCERTAARTQETNTDKAPEQTL